MAVSVVFIHIGKQLPDYIYDSIYQSLLINCNSCKHYVIIDDTLIKEFIRKCQLFNLDILTKNNVHSTSIIQPIPISILQNFLNNQSNFQMYTKQLEKYNVSSFRDGFWVSTTSRFFYIQAFMQMFQVSNLFHIENDIMMYESFDNICSTMKSDYSSIWMVQDSPNRVVPSILFFPNADLLLKLTNFIAIHHENSDRFVNDMDILGKFQPKFTLPFDDNSDKLIFDGAAIGQYLGGVDLRNTNYELSPQDYFHNKTVGFVNETSVFKPNTCNFSRTNIETNDHLYPLKMFLCQRFEKISLVANLHIHSKQLYQFSSVFTTNFNDIITGDRVLSLCDFVIATNDIFNFHKGIQKYAKEIVIVKDWNNVNIKLLNSYFINHCNTNNTNTVKLFIYTHIADYFQKYIAPYLVKGIDFALYFHNSDHSFNSNLSPLLELENIKQVFAQNIDHPIHTKLNLLPIGIANSMWKHGNLVELYTVMKNTYYLSKHKNIYVNINPGTFSYRQELLNYINQHKTFTISDSKPYIDYLYELSQHRFCLCIRGNGIDTHRFWEALYLGVIPVIINNKKTNCDYFVQYVKNLGVPLVCISNSNNKDIDSIFKIYNEAYFSHEKYRQILGSSENYIFSSPFLKLSFYQ